MTRDTDTAMLPAASPTDAVAAVNWSVPVKAGQFPPTVPLPLMPKVTVAVHAAAIWNVVGVPLPSVTAAIGAPPMPPG